MAYHINTVRAVRQNPPNTLGSRLGYAAVKIGLPVTKISAATGATRQTVYAWMRGGPVFTPYRATVTKTINILQASKTSEEAWRNLCSAFNLTN